MADHAPIRVLSNHDSTIIDMFAVLWDPDASASASLQAVTNIGRKVVEAFLASTHLSPSTQVTLIPVLRAGLPMYVAASPLFSASDTALVQCFRDKSTNGAQSVHVNWMGANPSETTLHSHISSERHLIILDTILATGATILKLCDELSNRPAFKRKVTVLCCYASPQALSKIAGHRAVHSVIVAHQADTVDDNGYLIPSTHGDMGDKLFGKKAT